MRRIAAVCSAFSVLLAPTAVFAQEKIVALMNFTIQGDHGPIDFRKVTLTPAK